MKNGPYELIIAPKEYPGKKYRNRYIYEHHFVIWKNLGIIINKNQIIHHKNGNTRDNRIENLEILSTSKHNHHHANIKSNQSMIPAECFKCKKSFNRKGNFFRHSIKLFGNRIYCSRKCQHLSLIGRKNHPDLISIKCDYCYKSFDVENYNYKKRMRNPSGKSYCSRQCLYNSMKS